MGKKNFRDITSLKVGGRIKHFFEVKNKEDLISAVIFAKSNNLPIFTIGDGTDIVVSDDDYNGVVIKYISKACSFGVGNSITAEAGMNWDKLVEETVNRNLQGIECLSGIPGTVGAAPIQNIGAYGQELSDTFASLTAYNIDKEKFVTFAKNDCKFGYRSSKFKNIKFWQKFIITDVTLELKININKNLNIIRKDILDKRREKLEDPKLIPNAGSFFINPFIDKNKKIALEKEYPEMKFYPVGDKFKISAGFLIEKTGWKGKSLGPVKVSDKHALVITNPLGAGGFDDIQKLANAIIKDVYKKFKIKLIPEVQYIDI
jgi:UDP-N-acetylmuramate dehydrogenase